MDGPHDRQFVTEWPFGPGHHSSTLHGSCAPDPAKRRVEMLFVTLGNARDSTTKSRVARRAGWKYPEGIRVIGEYWLMRPDPFLVLISESDSPESMLAALADWDDVMDITVTPAVSSEQGLKAAAALLAAQ
jgi:hypothetical protein